MLETLNKPNQVVQYVISPEDLKEIVRELVAEVRVRVLNAKEEEDNNRLLDINAACKEVNKTRTTLWRWEKCGYLRPIKQGAKKLYRYSDLIKVKEGNYEG